VFLLVLAPGLLAQDQPDSGPSSLAPRDFLNLFDIDQTRLATLTDGQPLDDAQHDLLLELLYHLRRYPLAAVDRFSLDTEAAAKIAADPAAARGQMYLLAGRVTRVERVAVDDARRERLLLSAYFRCTLLTDQGLRAEVAALEVPKAWKLDEPIDERASVRAMFLKMLPAEGDAAPTLLFAAGRVAWHPETALGKLGMDYGLFDTVRDKTGLEEREAFYQLLAAVRRADPDALRRTAREEREARRADWQRMADDTNASAADRAAAKRATERAAAGVSDIVPLFNDPASQRGNLVTVQGEALRAIEIRVDDADVIERFGIRRYYEVEMLTDDSQNNPLVCCVAALPEGMPLGNNIHVGVRITGFFLKSWAYRPGAATSTRRQLAPLLVARTLSVLEQPSSGSGTLLGIVLLLALTATAIVMLIIRRADRRALAAARRARVDLPDRLSLDELHADEHGEADQR
jgi:hypothetical protein